LALANISHRKKLERQSANEFTEQINLEKIGRPINSKLVQYIPVNGKGDLEMVMVSRHGQTELSTLESGVKTELMAKVNSSMWMVMSMMVFGLMIKQTVQAYIDM